MPEKQADMIIVGAGLSGLLTAWRCLDVNPDLKIMMIEASDKIAGDHTWSFNLTDVDEGLRDWVKPFIAYQWDSYDVKFPKRERTLDITYCTGNSETLRACVQPHIESGRLAVKMSTRVIDLQSDHVILDTKQKLSAKCVLDARGFEPNENVFLGYQKFVGRTIRTKEPHGLKRPIIMDATVEQLGGYRFVYCLPFTEHEVLVEDTYYTDGAELSENDVVARIDDYINAKGWSDHELVRQEKGVLPITLATAKNYAEFGDVETDIAVIGIRGGFYHAVTGYSFPAVLELAEYMSYLTDRMPETLERGFDTVDIIVGAMSEREEHWKNEKFLRLLNRMLFRAAMPEERYAVLQRFYGLNEGLIERFYAGKLKWYDKLRILIGKPPVPVSKALYNFSEKAFITRERAKRESK